MTKTEALYKFYNRFGIPAYPVSNVPDKASFPYITYENTTSKNGNSTMPTVNLWYHTDSEAVINAKAEEISKYIGLGCSIPCDDGVICIYGDDNWRTISDPKDMATKRRFTNLMIVFNTF